MDPMNIVAFRADRQVRQLTLGAPIADHEATVRHWSYRLIEPLTARRVTVVEGVSDRILVERAAELAGMDLDRLGIALFELDGSGLFPTAYKVFGPPGFDLPLNGLLDEDARVAWADAVGIAPADLESEGYVVCDPDLEGVYVDALGVDVVIAMLLASPLIIERSLLTSCGVSVVGNVTRELLLNYCRHKKHKVAAALAVAAAVDRAQALSLSPLTDLLKLLI
jgi:putative ATP-dependent endonuclease of OLD family